MNAGIAQGAVGERWYRERIAIALDELNVGDVRGAVETLLRALEGSEATVLANVCDCGARFEWPGLLDKHRTVDCRLLWSRDAN